MRFEWNETKNKLNRLKHGIPFQVACQAFNDPFCFTIPDRKTRDEDRLWTIGRLRNLTIIVVVHTTQIDEGEEVIRIISARKATPRERKLYEEADE